MGSAILIACVVLATLLMTAAIAWLAWSLGQANERAREIVRQLEAEQKAERARTAEAAKSQETRREVDRGSFGDAVDRL